MSLGLSLLGVGLRLEAQTLKNGGWGLPVGGWISRSSAATNDNGTAIYVGVETAERGRMVAFSPAGDLLWSELFPRWIDATPLVGPDGTIYIGCVDGKFYALRPGVSETRRKWEFRTGGEGRAGGFISSSAALSPDGATIYFGCDDGYLYALSAATGERRWDFKTGGPIWSSPAVGADGTIYFGSNDRKIYALNSDGSERWPAVETGGEVSASPAIGADGTIFIGSFDQRFYAINANGTKRWEYFTNGWIDASAAIGADGTVYVPSTDRNVYAFNPDGPDERRVKWAREIGVTSVSTPTVRGDGAIIFGADDNRLWALKPEDGGDLWKFDAGQQEVEDGIEASPLIAPDGAIYIGSLDGFLYKIIDNGSPLSAASSWPAFQRGVTRTGRAERATGEGRLLNMSTRAAVGGNETLIVGFVVEASGSRAHLVRAIGPTLERFGVSGFMPDPQIQTFNSGGQPLFGGANDNWDFSGGVGDTIEAVGAFALNEGSKDATVLLRALRSGAYTAWASSSDGTGGVVLVEVYDAIAGEPARLVNLSTRTLARAGENALFAGFVVGGTAPTRLLLRGVGPGLGQFGVTGTLARPTLSLYSAAPSTEPQRPLHTNAGWTTGGLGYDRSSVAARVGAFALPAGSADAAMVVTVEPGAYTVQISSADGGVGEALVEIYVVR